MEPGLKIFFRRRYLLENQVKSSVREEASVVAEVKEKELVLKNDVKMPPRSSIRQELIKVSQFTEDEVSILYWSSLYKAYSLIVRYQQEGVEEEFRRQAWFSEALNELHGKKQKSVSPERGYEKSKPGYDYTVHLKKSKNTFSKN